MKTRLLQVAIQNGWHSAIDHYFIIQRYFTSLLFVLYSTDLWQAELTFIPI